MPDADATTTLARADATWLATVTTAEAFFATPFAGDRQTVRWTRLLPGDFAEVARLADTIDRGAERVPLDDDTLATLRRHAHPDGCAAIDALLLDLELLRQHGHEPDLEWLRRYRRDDDPDLPTDVHSFHVDRADVPTETVLCTYYGPASEVLPRRDARRRVDEAALRARLRARFAAEQSADDGEHAFVAWLAERSYDLHFAARDGAAPLAFDTFDLCRLAVQHPGSAVAACVHRAPAAAGARLLLIS
jgi:hypothetical protein